MAYGYYFVEEAQQRGIFTIGIGDGGNEIGFGRVHAAVKAFHPAGLKCLCPCGAGVVTVVGTDVLIAGRNLQLGRVWSIRDDGVV